MMMFWADALVGLVHLSFTAEFQNTSTHGDKTGPNGIVGGVYETKTVGLELKKNFGRIQGRERLHYAALESTRTYKKRRQQQYVRFVNGFTGWLSQPCMYLLPFLTTLATFIWLNLLFLTAAPFLFHHRGASM